MIVSPRPFPGRRTARRWRLEVHLFTLFLVCAATLLIAHRGQAETPRETIAKAIALPDDQERIPLVESLAGSTDPEIKKLLDAWKLGEIYVYEAADAIPNFEAGARIPIRLGEKNADDAQQAIRLDTLKPLLDAANKPIYVATYEIELADTSSELRTVMKAITDLFSLSAANPKERLNAVNTLGWSQDLSLVPTLEKRVGLEKDSKVKRALREAINIIKLKSEDRATQLAAVQDLGAMGSIGSRDFLKNLREEVAESNPPLAAAVTQSLKEIESHISTVNFLGTIFRGLSTGSILLVVAIGLAITFGLMGVINMAHGEIMVVGAYTAYCVQNIFGAGLVLSPFGFGISIPGFGFDPKGGAYNSYFLVALPFAFLMAALVGLVLERTVIQFLYRRPLESLLATWGVSLVLQQLFRSVFGANNVQVSSPTWLSGNWTINDILIGWNRVFVIGFAVLIILLTWLILNKTSLGLLIRAVMQNRQMAACMGVRTERVNMMTFAFGSGLAGLAGAFLSQIGNVGPNLGQAWIVDCFMTVVVGGVGNIFGTVISALGIGVLDQSLQQILLNPVMGKILVLAGIILFLQWRPAGLFVTRSRSLES